MKALCFDDVLAVVDIATKVSIACISIVLYPMVTDTQGIARAKILGLIPCFKRKRFIKIRKGLIHFACSKKEKWKKYSLTTKTKSSKVGFFSFKILKIHGETIQ